MGRKLQKHGRFNQFLEVIRDEDYASSVILANALDGDLAALNTKRKKQRAKDNFIAELLKDSDDSKISLTEFFEYLINEKNEFIKWDTKFEESSFDLESDEDEDDNILPFTQIIEVLKCILCFEKPRDVVFKPCRHFKVCSDCYKALEQRYKNSLLLCPYCRQIVESSEKVYQ